jgi:hypothetical protein
VTTLLGTDHDRLWLAGLLEGEGTFDLSKGRYPRIRLAMTDRDVVGRAATLMDTSIRLSLKRAPSAPTWHSEVSGPRAEAIMREILPFMGARRSQRIAEVLAGAEYRRDDRDRKSIPGPAVTRPAGILEPAS